MDDEYPPVQQPGEADRDFLIRSLAALQGSHQAWADWIEAGGDMREVASKELLGEDPVQRQKVYVALYAKLIGIAKLLAEPLPPLGPLRRFSGLGLRSNDKVEMPTEDCARRIR